MYPYPSDSSDSGYSDAAYDSSDQYLSGPASSAGSHYSDAFDDTFRGPIDVGRGGGSGAGASFDPTAAMREMMNRVRLPMDDFEQPDDASLARHSDPFEDVLNAPSQRLDGLYRELETPASIYIPQRSFYSDEAGLPGPDYFLDPVAQELAGCHPLDDPTPRGLGWKGKERARAPGWHDFAPSVDPIHARPTFVPERQGGFDARDPFLGPRNPGAMMDQPVPQEQLRRDALAELRRHQDLEDRQRLQQWEGRLRQEEQDQQDRRNQWQSNIRRAAEYDDHQRQVNARNLMMMPPMTAPFGGMPYGGMPMGGLPYGGMHRPIVPLGPMAPMTAPATAANLPPMPNGLATAPNVPAVPLGTGFAPVIPSLAPAPLGFGIPSTQNSLDVHPAGNNGRARFTDQFMDDLRGLNSKLREALGEKIAALSDLNASRVAVPNVGTRQ